MFKSFLNKETRSALVNLILYLYIDQEPLSESLYPKMCWIFQESIEIKKNQDIFSQDNKSMYLDLLRNCLTYLNQKVENIHFLIKINNFYLKKYIKSTNILSAYNRLNKQIYTGTSSSIVKNEILKPNERKILCKNYLDNILLHDVIKVLSSFMKFNIFELLNADEKYFEFFPNLIYLLEFDSKNPLISKCLFDHREEKFKSLTSEKRQNIMKTGIIELKNLFGTVFENVSG